MFFASTLREHFLLSKWSLVSSLAIGQWVEYVSDFCVEGDETSMLVTTVFCSYCFTGLNEQTDGKTDGCYKKTL